MNFSDDDWKSFLSGPSILSVPSETKPSTFDLPNDLLLSEPTYKASKKASENKDTPLSPPSIQGKSSVADKVIGV